VSFWISKKALKKYWIQLNKVPRYFLGKEDLALALIK